MTEFRWIEDIEEFKGVAHRWDSALSLSGCDNPFLLSDFITTWWRHYGHNKKLMIFYATENGDVRGGIPLCMANTRLHRIVSHVGGCTANVTHFLSREKDLDIMEGFLSSLEKRNDWDVLSLERVLSHNPIIEKIQPVCKAYAHNFRCDVLNAGFNGRIDLSRGYEAVLDNLPGRLGRYLKNCRQKASKIGELKLVRISGAHDTIELFDEYRDLSVRSFKERNEISAFENNTYTSFFKELLAVFAQKNMLDAHKLMAGSLTLGVSFGYRFKKGFKWILTAYNPDLKKLRPGHLLIDALVQEMIKNKDPYFDMYYGGELFYKSQWCNQMIPLKRIEIYRKNFINKSLVMTKRKIRNSKFFMDTLKKARRMVYGISKVN